jgi:hypothetical protein
VKTADLRKPHQWFPVARSLTRRIIYHSGPTNSGKTYNALVAMKVRQLCSQGAASHAACSAAAREQQAMWAVARPAACGLAGVGWQEAAELCGPGVAAHSVEGAP